MEAYKVWVTLNLRGDAHKKMEMFLKLVNKTNAEVNKLLRTLDKFSIKFGNLSSTFSTINPQINIYNINVQKSTSVMNSATYAANRYAVALTRVNNSVRVGGAGSGGGIGRGHGGFAHGAVAGFGARHIAGLGAAAAGYAGAHTIMGAYHTGGEYQKKLSMLQGQNIPGLGRDQIERFVNSTNVHNVSNEAMLEALADAATITKNSTEAMGVAPMIAKMNLIMHSLGRSMSDDQMQAAIKTSEIVSGSKESNILNKHLDMMFQAWVSSNGKVQPSQYQSIARRSRGYTKGMDPKFFYYGLEPLIQEFGVSVGPMIAQFYQHMKAGRLTTGGAKELGKMGLIKPGSVELDKVGRIKGMKPGGILGGDVMDENIFEWIDKFLSPAMDKMGLKTSAKQLEVLGKIFTNTDLTMVSTYLSQKEKFQNAMGVNENTAGISSMLAAYGGMHQEHIDRLTSSFTNFKLALDKFTGPMLDNIADGLSVLFKVLQGFLIFYKAGEQASNHDPIGALKTAAPTLIDWAWNGYNKITDVTSPTNSDKKIELTGDVYLNSEKMGKAFFNSASNSFNTAVQHGTTGINPYASPFSTALSYQGMQNQ